MENKSIIIEIDEQSKKLMEEINCELNSSIDKVKTDLFNLFGDYQSKLEKNTKEIDSKLSEVTKMIGTLQEINTDVNQSISDAKENLIKLFEEYKKNLEAKTSEIMPEIINFKEIIVDTKKLLTEVKEESKTVSEENKSIKEELSNVIKELKFSNLPFYKKLFLRRTN